MDIDVVNRLARDHQRRFHRSLPHPKMDSLVTQLSTAIDTGTKSIVFVRRVASVDELQRKLEERYDEILFSRLRAELRVPKVLEEVETLIAGYRGQRNDERHSRKAVHEAQQTDRVAMPDETSNSDSFFAWFFRGEGPNSARLSGADARHQIRKPERTLRHVLREQLCGRVACGAASRSTCCCWRWLVVLPLKTSPPTCVNACSSF